MYNTLIFPSILDSTVYTQCLASPFDVLVTGVNLPTWLGGHDMVLGTLWGDSVTFGQGIVGSVGKGIALTFVAKASPFSWYTRSDMHVS